MSCRNCNVTGHFARDCPQPRKAPQCYNCGAEGHISRECPKATEGKSTTNQFQKCYECDQTGHLARDCPNKKAGGAPRAGGFRGRASCFNCGKRFNLVAIDGQLESVCRD